MNKISTLISVIVPVFNEGDNVFELYKRMIDVFSERKNEDFELVFIDDGSTDVTWTHIDQLGKEDTRVRGVRLSRNFGQQVALSAGLDYVTGEAVVMMDGDLQHPPEVIGELLDKWKEGYDVVYTIREVNKAYNLFHRSISNLYYWMFSKIARMDLPKGVVDFRIISKKVCQHLQAFPERTRFVRGLVNWVGFKSVAITYTAEKRHKGITKYSFFKLCRLAFTSIMSFSSFPLYISGFLGLIVACFSSMYIVYAIYVKFFTTQTVPGWTSILVSVLFLGGVQLIAIGVLGGYIAKIYEEVKQRPLYIIESTSNIAA